LECFTKIAISAQVLLQVWNLPAGRQVHGLSCPEQLLIKDLKVQDNN
jgi:hypothetical protein